MAAPLTPDETAAIVAEYARTGNQSEAGRAAGKPPSTAHDVLVREGVLRVSRRKLHARACARAEREGRRALREGIAKLRKALDALDAQALPPIIRALSDATGRIESLQNSLDRRRTSRLEREAMRRNLERDPSELTPEQRRARIAELEAKRAASVP